MTLPISAMRSRALLTFSSLIGCMKNFPLSDWLVTFNIRVTTFLFVMLIVPMSLLILCTQLCSLTSWLTLVSWLVDQLVGRFICRSVEWLVSRIVKHLLIWHFPGRFCFIASTKLHTNNFSLYVLVMH